MKKYYCDNCDCEQEVEEFDVEEQECFDNVSFTYTRHNLVCKHCHEEVYDYENEKKNSIAKADAYRKLVGLLTSEEIRDIRTRYHCSQTEFAKILSIGEKNITRYEAGTIQSRQSDSYISMMKDPRNFYKLYMGSSNKDIFDVQPIAENLNLDFSWTLNDSWEEDYSSDVRPVVCNSKKAKKILRLA